MRQARPVVVLGLYHDPVLRRVAQLGYAAIGVTENPTEPGFHSRFGRKLCCPDPLHEHEAWVAFMLELASGLPEPAGVIPTSDRFVLGLDRASARLAGRFRFHDPGHGLMTALTSKHATFVLAERHRFPMPATRVVHGAADVLSFCETAQWPVLIKPDLPFHWRVPQVEAAIGHCKVLTADDPQALAARFEAIRAHSPDAIAQEIVPGPDTNLLYWVGLVRADGRVGGRIVGRKLRVHPVHFGSATLVELIDLPALEEQCERFLQQLGFRGLCGIEVKVDARDGAMRLIECNPRYGLWDAIGIEAGVDLVGESIEALFGREPEPRRALACRRRWVDLRRDLKARRVYHAEGSLSNGAWLRSLRPPIMVSDFPFLHDFPYAWHNLRGLAPGLGRRLAKLLRRATKHDDAGVHGRKIST
jgi:predicted ATP-grasp superfamily ATP-dependent carboligase